jgi:hypothetical protein
VKDPIPGVNVGAKTCEFSVYVCFATALVKNPVALAIAEIVSVVFTEIAPVYFVEEVVGALPSVV